MTYFAYIHSRPDGRPFYVGKGLAKRTREFRRNRNPYYLRVVNKYGEGDIKVTTVPCSSERAAFDLEKILIKQLRLSGASLTNMSDGGEGQSGFKFSAESKAKISAAGRGRKMPPHVKEMLRSISVGRTPSEETRAKMRAVDRGYVRLNPPMLGKKHSLETRMKYSAARTGVPKPKVDCSVCGKSVSVNLLHRWHEENCKFKVYTDGKES